MSVDRAVNYETGFRDLGVVELRQRGSLARKNEVVQIVAEALKRIGDKEGQLIIAGGITDRQKRHLGAFRNRRGLKDRVQVERGVPYHDGDRLAMGTLIQINPKVS